ncbi:MAG: ATP synthase F1 subunit epsilon [Phycisphaerae bacterium]|nr:MAG: ATP synthase F1 subunit epsilon [Planctomycetota bacterium]KAB2948901.1 MAG: ATP synthase F1 subunit epsilon [Phycisphaerae bacterium]MBE7457944.1 ATP synthase F1 subunit epsilon [Planctomycetia bacterium]MBZ0171265.1 ATP synthase F1 subunit epsilon [Phycisphaerales bacterium]MCK6465547.1 ATP synthase F1 subunit epsilon [Phycisphaerae bacterium]
MAKATTFHCSVITPEREVLSAEATSVVFPAHDGEVGVLVDRAPLLFALGIGILRIDGEKGSQRFFIDGGFAQMLDNNLTILTSQALSQGEVSSAKAREALAAAEGMKITDDASWTARDKAIRRAKEQLKLAEQVG